MTHTNFTILNSHVTVTFKIYPQLKSLCGKTKKFKMAVFLPAIYTCI